MLTTNGTLLRQREALLLGSPAVKKVSVSVHSFEGNGGAGRTWMAIWMGASPLPGRRPGRGSGAPCGCGTWTGRRPRGPTVKTARSSPGSGRSFPGSGGQTGVGPPWPRASIWKFGGKIPMARSLRPGGGGPPLLLRPAGPGGRAVGRHGGALLSGPRGGRPSWEPVRDIPGGDPVRPAGRCQSIMAFSQGEAREALCRRCAFTRRFQ